MRASFPFFALTLAACQMNPDAGNRAEAVNADSVTNHFPNGNASYVAADDPDRPVSNADPTPATPPSSASPDCPVLSSSAWQAQVDAMPGPNNNPNLIVSGRVTVPTGGYRVALRMGQVAESYPVQVTVYLDATPPTGMATQALVTHEARGSWPSADRVGSVTVRCGSRVLARIDNVATAH